MHVSQGVLDALLFLDIALILVWCLIKKDTSAKKFVTPFLVVLSGIALAVKENSRWAL